MFDRACSREGGGIASMVARVAPVAALLHGIAFVAALAGTACGGDGGSVASPATASAAPFVLVSGTAAASTPKPRVTGTPVALPTPQPIAVADDEVWGQIPRDTEGVLRPVLRPPSLPDGLETVLVRLPNKPMPDSFAVEYAGPGKLLVIAAGPLNPRPGFEPGHAELVTVRGQQGVLAVEDDRDPAFSSWVYWQEPGSWRPEGAQTPAPRVTYLVRVGGMSLDELFAIVEALSPWPME